MVDVEKQLRLNRIVEFVWQQEFPFDIHDVEDDFDGILIWFGIDNSFSESERLLLKSELLKIAEIAQAIEIARTVSDSEVVL